MINSCETRKSMQLFGDAMVPWMSPSQMRVLLSDSKRLQVIHAFIKSSPPDIAQVFPGFFFHIRFYLLYTIVAFSLVALLCNIRC